MRRLALLAATVAAVLALGTPAANAAPSWLPASVVSGSAKVVSSPQVAMDPGGDAVAVWRGYDGSNARIEASARPAGGSWSAPVFISPASLETYDPTVVISPAGEATAGWSTDGSIQAAQVATMSPGGTWGGPITLSPSTVLAEEPHLAVDSAGDLTATWQQYDGVHFHVVVATRAAGGVWSGPVLVSPLAQEAETPAVAVDDHGDAVVVWSEALEIDAAARFNGGSWGAPVELSESGEEVHEPSVVMDPAGEAVAIWRRYSGAYFIAQAATMTPGGAWAKAINLSNGDQNAYEPKVAIDSGGEAIAIWGHPSAGAAIVEGASRPPGSGWGEPTQLTPTGQFADDASLAMSPEGLAALVWAGGPASVKTTPYGATRPKGGDWSAAVGLAPNAKLGDYPIASTDSYGDAVAVWGSYAGETSEIEAAGFDGAGPQLSAVSIPTAGEAGTPLSFSVKATGVWSSPGPASWLLGDGAIVKGDQVTHGFLKGGDYPVSVTVTDAVGNSTTATGSVSVTPATTPTGAKQGLARAHRVALVRKGRAALELRCGGGQCAGVAKLYAPPPRGGKRRRRRPVLTGQTSFRIASGGHEVAQVKVSRNVLTRLRRSPTGHLSTTLRGAGIAPGKVMLHEAKRKHLRRHR